MKKITKFVSMILTLSLSLILLSSCGLLKNAQQFTTEDGYLNLRYPDSFQFNQSTSNGNDTYTLALNDQNFVILAVENIKGVDQNLLTTDVLKKNVEVYAKPFIDQGFSVHHDEIIQIGDNEAYEIVYADPNFTVGYIQWYEKGTDESKLYKIMYVHDKDNVAQIENIIKNIKINK